MGKKRVAKHILDSQENQSKNQSGTLSDKNEQAHQKNKKRKRNKKRSNDVVKDPKEAHSYLSLWQQQQKQGKKGDEEDVPLWRFNKNTQSWLLRHMYNIDKIAKGTFSILTLYLEDLKGASRQRIYEDAVRRALRYREWEKNNQGSEKETDVEVSATDEKNESIPTSTTKTDDAGSDDEEDKQADEKRWKGLNDHDKRKEYKRARKVIDALTSTSNDADDK